MNAGKMIAVVVAAGMCFSAWGQDSGKGADAVKRQPADAAGQPSQDEMMKMMEAAGKPGKEHARLGQFVGEWKAKIESRMDPSSPVDVSEGVMKNTWMLGERFLKQEYKGSFMGAQFDGFGMFGYDNVKKAYIGLWSDTMSTGFMVMEGSFDEKTSSWTMTGEMLDPTGEECTMREVIRIVDANKHVMEMYAPGPDGKEFKMMTITYTRAASGGAGSDAVRPTTTRPAAPK